MVTAGRGSSEPLLVPVLPSLEVRKVKDCAPYPAGLKPETLVQKSRRSSSWWELLLSENHPTVVCVEALELKNPGAVPS